MGGCISPDFILGRSSFPQYDVLSNLNFKEQPVPGLGQVKITNKLLENRNGVLTIGVELKDGVDLKHRKPKIVTRRARTSTEKLDASEFVSIDHEKQIDYLPSKFLTEAAELDLLEQFRKHCRDEG